jgi:hypothetical protein
MEADSKNNKTDKNKQSENASSQSGRISDILDILPVIDIRIKPSTESDTFDTNENGIFDGISDTLSTSK